MKSILRSVIDIAGNEDQVNLIANLQKLMVSKIEWTQPADQRIYDQITHYFQLKYEVPSGQTLMDFFEVQRDQEAIERVKDFTNVQAYIRTNFAHLLTTTLEKQGQIKAITLFKEAGEIAGRGLIIDKEKKQGVSEALAHVYEHGSKLIASEFNSRAEGDARDDGQEVWDRYQHAKNNPSEAWGKLCGLNEIDKVIKGGKRGELWLHAAFTGELKSTFALNWAYNLVTRYRTNVFYATLEMPYTQVVDKLYVMHSSNHRFRALGYAPLSYAKVIAGELTPEEEKFWQLVITDFTTNEEYGSLHFWSPIEDANTDDIRVKAEIVNQKHSLGLVIIDHGGIVQARRKKQSKDYVIELNSVIRDSKRLALQFNNGQKILVMLLFQISREGKEYADKNEGRYKLKALSYANEAERSADYVTTTYLNEEHRTAGTTIFDMLKRRDGAFFKPFLAGIDWNTSRIYNRDTFSNVGDRGLGIDNERDISQALAGMFSV